MCACVFLCVRVCVHVQDFLDYERAHNRGATTAGVLTVDGAHPCVGRGHLPCPAGSHGNLLIANSVARAVLAAVGRRPAPTPAPTQ